MEPRRWQDVAEERMNELVTRQMVNTANLTVAKIRLAQGAVVPLHQHVSEQVTMVESGCLRFLMGGEELVVRGGELLEIPSDVPHQVEALEDSVATDVFAPRREDWIRGEAGYFRK
jgi:quercetin dioxygenase-like cupin family protein